MDCNLEMTKSSRRRTCLWMACPQLPRLAAIGPANETAAAPYDPYLSGRGRIGVGNGWMTTSRNTLCRARAGVADRCTLTGGDFFEAVPAGGDVYVLTQILHDWNDDRCVTILRRLGSGWRQRTVELPRRRNPALAGRRE